MSESSFWTTGLVLCILTSFMSEIIGKLSSIDWTGIRYGPYHLDHTVWSWNINAIHIFFKLQSHLGSRPPISEYLAPETKTVIEYDCMPTFANILAASIADMNENRIVKYFGIKKGSELGIFKTDFFIINGPFKMV